MGVRLKKLELMEEAKIKELDKEKLLDLVLTWRERLEEYQGILFRIRKRVFGKNSEKSPRDKKSDEKPADNKPTDEQPPAPPSPTPRSDTTKLPSERYPDAPLREDEIDFSTPQVCQACGATMQDSGMTEKSEYLDVGEKEYIVVQQKRHKHRCSHCHGSIVTAPPPPRVIPGGSYSDGLIVDATLSKYCDLIPMERYCEMAGRNGFYGLPPHSLISASHRLAEFLFGVYELIKKETLDTEVLLADETPHRMLEGDERKRWYLWGFSNKFACFFECHDSRSGDVSSEVLKLSRCQVLLTDAYCGYKKSVAQINQERVEKGILPILPAYCNAHCRRQFSPGEENVPVDAKFMVKQYEKIYRLNSEAKGLPEDGILEKRAEMKPYFEKMRAEALEKVETYPSKSGMAEAYSYLLKYYDGLTLFLSNPKIPIDNNTSERLLRSHVVGRKTWYGTHSRQGAKTAAVHFSLVESCKMNRINPRYYYLDAIDRIHHKQEPLTPRQYKELLNDNTC